MRKGCIALLSTLIGAAAGFTAGKMFLPKNQSTDKVFKFKTYYSILNQWLKIKEQDRSLEQYLLDNNYSTIAIYGMGELGERLIEELSSSKIEIKYGIDKMADGIYSDLPMYTIDDSLEPVDAIIVTAVFAFSDIATELERITTIPIISLEDIVFGIN